MAAMEDRMDHKADQKVDHKASWLTLRQSGAMGRFALLCLGVWLHAADSLVTATLVPAIVGDIGGIAYVAWTIALYQIGAILKFKPLRIRSFEIAYPKPGIAFRQLFAAPLEIIGAAGIIYFALPDSLNPGFFIVLGMFLASFCAGLISNAPGGAGVFEIVFFMIMLPGGTSPDDPAAAHTKAQILAALLVFRLLYLLIPLAISCAIVLYTERQAFAGLLGSVLGGKNGVETEPVPVETGRQDPPKQ